MRFLYKDDDGVLKLTEYFYEDIPKYAILSHTWGSDNEEVHLDDIEEQKDYHNKLGYAKLEFCLQQIEKDKIRYVWIDTCCMNKKDAWEFARSIRMMYQWYSNAEKCYVLLSDVGTEQAVDQVLSERSIVKSRWFKRGWTLQELLAPLQVEFYSATGRYLGTKSTLAVTIAQRTGIDEQLLVGITQIDAYRLETRRSWAIGRETRSPEDRAYCLMGLLGVYIGLEPGETGAQAMSRLTDAVKKARSAQLLQIQIEDGATELQAQREAELANVRARIQQDKRAELIDALNFENMHSRREQIQQPHSTTCHWLKDNDIWQKWLAAEINDESSGILWIKGKPGAGKSTLIRHANEICPVSDKVTCLSYYFHARGSKLQNSTEGMYRSFLSQLSTDSIKMQDFLLQRMNIATHSHTTNSWPIAILKEVISLAFLSLSTETIHCYIDALDECAGDVKEVQRMVKHFKTLSSLCSQSGHQLRICFASRHYPPISMPSELEINLDVVEEHHEDMKRFVDDQLDIGSGSEAQDVRAQVMMKAEGVFMWVVLVIGLLNEDFLEGQLYQVQETIRALPRELNEVFKELIARDSKRDDSPSDRGKRLGRFKHCIHWLLFCKTPISSKEFYCAMALYDSSGAVAPYDTSVGFDVRKRLVNSRSKGLATVSEDEHETVQFIHETVRHWLLHDSGPRELFVSTNTEDTFQAHGHEVLKSACARYLQSALSALLARDENVQSGQWPLLRYCYENTLFHAETAASAVPQGEFLRTFDFRGRSSIRCRSAMLPMLPAGFVRMDQDCYFALARGNHVNLVAQAVQSGIKPGGLPFPFAPLYIALATNQVQIAVALLSAYNIDIDPSIMDVNVITESTVLISQHYSPFRLALDHYNFAFANNLLNSDPYLEQLLMRNAQSQSLELSYESDAATTSINELRFRAVEVLFGKVIGARDSTWIKSLLEWSVQPETLAMLSTIDRKILTAPREGADLMPNATRSWLARIHLNSTPVFHVVCMNLLDATDEPRLDLMRLLLKYGADIYEHDRDGLTLLHKLCCAQHYSSDMNPIFTGQRRYDVASRHVPMIKLLLEAGAFPETKDRDRRRTAFLHLVLRGIKDHESFSRFASGYRYMDLTRQLNSFTITIMDVLLDAGADVDARDSNGCTSLLHLTRASWDSPEVMERLLVAGANPKIKDNSGISAMLFALGEPSARSARRLQLFENHSWQSVEKPEPESKGWYRNVLGFR